VQSAYGIGQQGSDRDHANLGPGFPTEGAQGDGVRDQQCLHGHRSEHRLGLAGQHGVGDGRKDSAGAGGHAGRRDARQADAGTHEVIDSVAQERGKIVRAASRRRLGAVTTGLLEELLSPDIGGAFELFLSTFEPGAELRTFTRRATEEEGYLVSGVLDLWIGKKRFRLNSGDSFRIVDEPFRWCNPGRQDAVVVWVISPPTY